MEAVLGQLKTGLTLRIVDPAYKQVLEYARTIEEESLIMHSGTIVNDTFLVDSAELITPPEIVSTAMNFTLKPGWYAQYAEKKLEEGRLVIADEHLHINSCKMSRRDQSWYGRVSEELGRSSLHLIREKNGFDVKAYLTAEIDLFGQKMLHSRPVDLYITTE